MEYMQVLVEVDLHRKVKAAAALAGQSIREFTEGALRAKLSKGAWRRLAAIEPAPTVLTDERVEYEAGGEG